MSELSDISKGAYKRLKFVIRESDRNIFYHSTPAFDSSDDVYKTLVHVGYIKPISSIPADESNPPVFLGYQATERGRVYVEKRKSRLHWELLKEVAIPIITLLIGWSLGRFT